MFDAPILKLAQPSPADTYQSPKKWSISLNIYRPG